MNLKHPKNLEVLRGEYDKLGMRIARLAFIRTTLFVLFVFSLASAFQTISSHDASGIVDRIRELVKITKDEPELSYFLKAIYFPPRAKTKEPATSPTLPSGSAEVFDLVESPSSDQVTPPSTGPIPRTVPTPGAPPAPRGYEGCARKPPPNSPLHRL